MTDKVCRVVATIMGVPAGGVNEDSSPASLPAWDSLRHMKLILAIEEAFGLQLADDEIVSMTNVRSIVALLERKREVRA